MTRLFSTHPYLVTLNQHSLTNARVHVINSDAFPWLQQTSDAYDFVVVDFPDPTNYSLGKLYTTAFYRLLAKHLSAQGLAVVQSTSPLFAAVLLVHRRNTQQAGLKTIPYHLYVPSFGEWGFVLTGLSIRVAGCAMRRIALPVGCARATDVQFPVDMLPVDAAQPPQRSGAGAVRTRLARDHALSSSRRQFLTLRSSA
jgi:spermidine synthase